MNGTYFDCNVPKFCPECGQPFNFSDYLTRSDFFAKASHSCNKCQTKFISIHEHMDLSKDVQEELNRYR